MLHLRHALRRVPPAGRTAGHRAASTALWRWGLGEGLERTPQRVAEGEGVSAVACGLEHSAFVVDGQLYTFGANADHQLGRASENDAHCAVAKLVAPDGHQPQAQQVALGARHTAVISEGGVLWTCGYGGSFWFGAGALGLNLRGTVPELRMVMPFVQEGTEILQVTCGDMHSLVLDSEGRVYSTGQGFFGALGRGALASTGEELEFKEVVFFRKTTDSILNPGVEPQIVKLDAGREFSAAMSSHGELWVWGKNDYGQLGMGFEVMKSRDFCMKYPFLLRQLPMEGHVFRDVACGDRHIVAVTTAGAIYEWGDRRNFEPTAITLPSRYQDGLKGVHKVAAGESCSFALTVSGELYSWGRPDSGCVLTHEAHEEVVTRPRLVPPELFGDRKVLDLAVSKTRCLAITES